MEKPNYARFTGVLRGFHVENGHTMKKLPILIVVIISIITVLSLSQSVADDQRVGVARIMDAENLVFKEGEPTTMIFEFEPGDSVRIKSSFNCRFDV